MRRIKIAAGLVAVALLIGGAVVPAGANHSWDGFHWSRATNPAQLTVVDSVVGEWDSYLSPAVSDWERSTVLSLASTAGADSLVDRTACLPTEGTIRVCNAMYPDPTWLGLATVWLSGDHITMATAQVNDTWFDTSLYDDPSAKRHVLCQEIGHTFGLDHQYTEPTCMDDINGLFDPAFVGPGAHDFEQLGSIYAHRHSVAPLNKSPGTADCPVTLCTACARSSAWIERWTSNPNVGGSNPSGRAERGARATGGTPSEQITSTPNPSGRAERGARATGGTPSRPRLSGARSKSRRGGGSLCLCHRDRIRSRSSIGNRSVHAD